MVLLPREETARGARAATGLATRGAAEGLALAPAGAARRAGLAICALAGAEVEGSMAERIFAER
jgi:hypothetical protein